MTRAEAEEIFGMLARIYDLHPERSGEQAPVWAEALQPLDVELTMTVVSQFLKGRGPERFPNVVQFVQVVKRLGDRHREQSRPKLIEAGDELQKPVWVYAWEILRAVKDDRVMPEQEGGYHQLGLDWPPDGRKVVEGTEHVALTELGRVEAEKAPPKRSMVEPDPDCVVCRDTGWVEAGIRVYRFEGRLVNGSEQMAPCPSCDHGKLAEHPLEGIGAWGPDGFWRGQRWRVVRSGVVEVTP